MYPPRLVNGFIFLLQVISMLYGDTHLHAQAQRDAIAVQQAEVDSIKLVDVGFVTRKLSESCFFDTTYWSSISMNKFEILSSSNINSVFKISSESTKRFFTDTLSMDCIPVLEWLEIIGVYWKANHYLELIQVQYNFLSDSETYSMSYRFKRKNVIELWDNTLIETNGPKGEEVTEIVTVLIRKRHNRIMVKRRTKKATG